MEEQLNGEEWLQQIEIECLTSQIAKIKADIARASDFSFQTLPHTLPKRCYLSPAAIDFIRLRLSPAQGESCFRSHAV